MSAALPTAAASRCSGVLLAYGDGFRSPSWTISIVIVTRRAPALALSSSLYTRCARAWRCRLRRCSPTDHRSRRSSIGRPPHPRTRADLCSPMSLRPSQPGTHARCRRDLRLGSRTGRDPEKRPSRIASRARMSRPPAVPAAPPAPPVAPPAPPVAPPAPPVVPPTAPVPPAEPAVPPAPPALLPPDPPLPRGTDSSSSSLQPTRLSPTKKHVATPKRLRFIALVCQRQGRSDMGGCGDLWGIWGRAGSGGAGPLTEHATRASRRRQPPTTCSNRLPLPLLMAALVVQFLEQSRARGVTVHPIVELDHAASRLGVNTRRGSRSVRRTRLGRHSVELRRSGSPTRASKKGPWRGTTRDHGGRHSPVLRPGLCQPAGRRNDLGDAVEPGTARWPVSLITPAPAAAGSPAVRSRHTSSSRPCPSPRWCRGARSGSACAGVRRCAR